MSEQGFIDEYFYAAEVLPEEADSLLAEGWRHFGTFFFRYNLIFYKKELRQVLPLRVNLQNFSFSKSQRRIFKKNQDLHSIIRPIEITSETEELFHRHKMRFADGIPESLETFLSQVPDTIPCQALEVCVFEGQKLLAVSFFDVGNDSISSIYGMFEPSETKRSLGIYTMLLEIEFALKHQKKFYYHGYAYSGNSFYDYKKRFQSLEVFDWQGNWHSFSE